MSSFEEYFYSNVAKQIRKYRIERKLTQEQLSEMLAKNIKYIGHIERCERQISTRILIKLLDILRVQPSEFYNFDTLYDWKNM